MSDKLNFADDDQVQYSRLAAEEVAPEVLDHIIRQTEAFLKNVEVAELIDEDQPIACMPDGRQVNIREMKEIFYRCAPNVIIQLAYRVKYLQGNK